MPFYLPKFASLCEWNKGARDIALLIAEIAQLGDNALWLLGIISGLRANLDNLKTSLERYFDTLSEYAKNRKTIFSDTIGHIALLFADRRNG